ncbi:hypothetical protein KP509_22G080500 [Ceratopteris richardii]|nr:hypothetical protein KP509_22G080500 [Ceratopteris richardii]
MTALDSFGRGYRNYVESRNFLHDRERRRLEERRSQRDNCRGIDCHPEANSKQAFRRDTHFTHSKANDWLRKWGRSGNKLSFGPWNGKTDAEPFTQGSMSEAYKDRLFTDVSNYVKNVSVRDAQKSFSDVCRRLRRALRTLCVLSNDLSHAHGEHIEGQRQQVLSLTRDTFSGIRAAYAVRCTAAGKEQEQDTNVFPRLLELAWRKGENLFTSRQVRELESMMQAIRNQSKPGYLQKYPPSSVGPYEIEKGEDKDPKFRESSGNASATAQHESYNAAEISANMSNFEVGDEAEQPRGFLLDLNLCETSLEHSVTDSSTVGSVGLGSWISCDSEQWNVHGYDDRDAGSHPVPSIADFSGIAVSKGNDSLGSCDERNTQILKCPSFLTQSEHYKVVASFHEGFTVRSKNVDVLFSTPKSSDKGIVVEDIVNYESTTVKNLVPDIEEKLLGKDGQEEEVAQGIQQTLFPRAIISHQGRSVEAKESFSKAVVPELTLFPSFSSLAMEDGNFGGSSAELVVLRSQKNRDPRGRLDSQGMDLKLSQVDPVGDGFELIGTKQQGSLGTQDSVPNEEESVSFLTLGTGGWPLDVHTCVVDMPSIVDASSQITADSSSSSDELAQKRHRLDSFSKESFCKRPRNAAVVKAADIENSKACLDFQKDLPHDKYQKQILSDNFSSQAAGQFKHCTPNMESVVNNLSKPRIKPRDPRRALVDSLLEKSKIMALGKDNNSTESCTRAVIQANKDAAVNMSQSAVTCRISCVDEPILMNQTDRNELLSLKPTLNDGIVSRIAEINTSTGSNIVFHASNLTGTDGRGDTQVKKVSKPFVDEGKADIVRIPASLDLNVSIAGDSKKKEMINHWDYLEPLIVGLPEQQKQAVRQERTKRMTEQSRMFSARKLSLVLDLDHTLLNSAKFTEIEGNWETELQANELMEQNKFCKEGRRELYRFQHMGMWTKLRPGIWNFLARASQLYELHVYTMGNKPYATEMAKLLDPTGTLFAGRVISKGDDGDIADRDGQLPKSKDLDGVLGMDSAVVIIDDSAHVWPHHRDNLIVVERYMYFPCSRKQFGLPGPSLLEVGHDEREHDGMLASVLMVIERIHCNFFSYPRLHEVHVRDLLAKEQRSVLAGCKLVFSRVFPQGEIRPHMHPLWQLAERFGAVCSMMIDEGVTHVVAISLGTDKVNWALTTGRSVVRPNWLEASATLYRRAAESDYPVTA